MSTHIVATQHSFDEMLKQVKRTLLQTESVEGQMDTVQTKTPLHEQLEHWGLSPWPSDERMKKANLGGRRLEEGDPDILHLHAWMEHIDNWLLAHAQPIDSQDELKAINDTYDHMLMTPVADVADVLKRNHVMWETYRVLAPSHGQWPGSEAWIRPRNESVLPNFVRAYYNLPLLDETSSDNTDTRVSPLRLPRPIISPAFRHDGREGLGRISSDQVTFGIYDALIAPKEKWEKTAKGWPIYRPDPTNNKLAIKVAPIVENRNNLDAQRDEMWQIVRELSIADFDVIAMMMAQVLEEARNDGRAILPADTMLDYRGVGRRDGRDGYSAGRQPKLRVALSESVYRIAHLRITTDGFLIKEYNSKGGVMSSHMDINEPVLQLHSNYSRQRDDKTMLWEYSLGRWFTTFREKPNAFTAYMLERALSYHPTKQQWTKQLAYYLAFDMRRNADNGQELAGPISRFMDGARIPCDPRYALRAKDRFENSLRQVVKDGLIRIVQDDNIIDASSPEIDAWLPGGADALKGRNWLGAYRKLRVRLRCDEDIEHRYDIEIRKKKASVTERKTKKEAARPTAKGRAK